VSDDKSLLTRNGMVLTEFRFCIFRGDPPEPFRSWCEWAASGPPYQNVVISASPPLPDPPSQERT
jgi:hypothetical protein